MKKISILKTALLAFAACASTAVFAAGTLAPADSGLAPAEIINHEVKITLINGFARTEVNQTFRNTNSSAIEAVYTCPVPKSGALAEISIMNGETMMEGEVVSRKDAERIYGKEKESGNSAGLGEKNTHQNYRFYIANVAPNAEVFIKYVYYETLEVDTGTVRYLYPLEEGNTEELGAANFWTGVNSQVSGRTTVSVELKSAWPVADVRVPSAAGNVTANDLANGLYTAEYELADGLGKDFVFYYRLVDELPGRVEVIPYRAGADGAGTFMMAITPGVDIRPLENGADYLFVLDISGSMAGDKIRTLCEGVARAIGTMNGKDRFRIITFNTSAKDLTSGWVAATPENAEKWVEAVRNISALDGTDLYAGISAALKAIDADRVTSMILVTDAEANTGIICPKKFHKLLVDQDVRVFGFLIGNSSNWPLMRTVCDATGGFYNGVSNSDDIIRNIILAKSKIVFESLHDVSISIDGVKTYDLTGDKLGKLYRGQQMVVLGRYDKPGRAELTVNCRISGRDQVYKCEFDFPEIDTDNPELERLWAMRQVEQLEYLANIGKMPAGEVSTLIRDYGVNYQLVTDETSMVVLTDGGFARYKIERRNRDRSAVEHQAQSVRAVEPVKNYRVDNASAEHTGNKGSSNMFPGKAHSVGGGAIELTHMLLMLSGLGGIALSSRLNRSER